MRDPKLPGFCLWMPRAGYNAGSGLDTRFLKEMHMVVLTWGVDR